MRYPLFYTSLFEDYKIATTVLLLVLITLVPPHTYAGWKRLIGKIKYTDLTCGTAEVELVKFNPNDVKIKVLIFAPPGRYAETIAKSEGAAVVINAGFFTPQYKPIGLIVDEGKILNRLHNTSWWGIFYLKDNKADVINPKEWQLLPSIKFAVQAGPRLIVNGKIPSFKNPWNLEARSAICKDEQGYIVLAATTSPVTLGDWAKCLTTRGQGRPGCIEALNLDGGGSTQFSIIGDKIEIHRRGMTSVPSLIAVWPK